MRRGRPEELLQRDEDLDPVLVDEAADEASNDSDISAENGAIDGNAADDEWTYYANEIAAKQPPASNFVPAILGILGLAWTGFFLWANRDIFTTIPTATGATELIAQWCLPVAMLAVLYLIFMRNSTREAYRFADVSASLRAESEMLESRLKTVNNELSIAREFLTQETKELEFLGDQSSRKLNSAADLIRTSLNDGLKNMRKLDEVGETAYKNLEELREHLPVVINTAKDVANQIGNSGRAAQTEMTAMVATLKRIGEVGTAAKRSLDELTESSRLSLDNLTETAVDVKAKFERQFGEAETESNRIASLLRSTSTDVISAHCVRRGLIWPRKRRSLPQRSAMIWKLSRHPFRISAKRLTRKKSG